MEFIWRPNADTLGTDTQIFTHVLYDHYSSPPGFAFDILDVNSDWNDEEQKMSLTYDRACESNKLLDYINNQSAHYRTNEVFLIFGDDFRYMNAFQNYYYIDQMIEYMNMHHGD